MYIAFSWFCHVDDDIYINHKQLIDLLSLYDPKTEDIYLGHSWLPYNRPPIVSYCYLGDVL